MTKQVPEISLQRYIRQNFQEFNEEFKKLFNSEIESVSPNYPEDTFPDLNFNLKNGKTIPVEVEWKTSKFDHETNSKFRKFKEDGGLVMVGVIEEDVSLGLRQIKVNLDKFEKWYARNSEKLVKEELQELRTLEKMKKKRKPKLWVTLLTKKGNALAHFKPALEHETWGIQKNYKVHTGKGTRLKEIQEGDMIVFLAGLHGSYKSKKTGKLVYGRYSPDEWSKKSFNGKFDYICVFRITRGYFFSEEKIWVTGGKWKNRDELFPHRFKFNRNPLLTMKEMNVRDLSPTTKSQLQNVVYVNFRMCDPEILVDMMHNTKQINAEQYQEVLEAIPKIK